jgi:CheY-like chemotaxis protein
MEQFLQILAPPLESRRQRILVVDDHDSGRQSLCRLLDAMGYEVTSVKNGLSALETLKSSIAPDFVLTDFRLPDIDGLEVVQAAREVVPRPWIALITGWDFDADESRRGGIDWIFLKPLNIASIVDKLQQVSGPEALVQGAIGNHGQEDDQERYKVGKIELS